MEQGKFGAKDFFLNLGATVALYTVIVSLVNLLFTIINYAYPKIANGYYYNASQSISWPVAALIIFFPILILLMWLLEREYSTNPEGRNTTIHRLLTYITLFIAGLVMAGDLVVVLYNFIDGQELTTGFLLKVSVLLVVSAGLFTYYLSDIRGTLTSKSRKVWRIVTGLVILGSIVWGFVVLGSPATQRAYKYDEQRVNDLTNLNQAIISYYQTHSGLPGSIDEMSKTNYYYNAVDPQTGKSYEYNLVGQSAKAYSLCADFNRASDNRMNRLSGSIAYPYPSGAGNFRVHPAGHHCFTETIDISMYPPIKQ